MFDVSKFSSSSYLPSLRPADEAGTERGLPQYSHLTVRATYTRRSSLIVWSQTPSRNTACHEFANDQNTAGTWARTDWLSGRGVPNRAHRSNSARISASTV